MTGSAHTVLAAYWAQEYNRIELLGKQCSKRSGMVWCKLHEPGRVRLQGLSKVVSTVYYFMIMSLTNFILIFLFLANQVVRGEIII